MSTAAQNHSSSTATPARRDFRQEVTDSIVQMLEQGVAPWLKPWKSGSLELPFNPTSDRGYRGANALHLIAAGLKRGFGDPRWMTYKQAQENGWQVRQGGKGTQIEYWQFPETPPANQAADKGHETNAHVSGSAPIHRVYTVFNAQQIEGIPEYRPKLRQEWEIVESGEQILEHSGARIRHDQDDRAFYNRASDEIHLPLVAAFKSPADYYGTALHELAHWTGHPLRLDRPTLNDSYTFGDPTFFITLARFFDNLPGTHSIYTFLNMTSANPEFFSRDSLTRRKMVNLQERPVWLDEYLDRCWFPTATDLRLLWRAVAAHKKQFDAIYAPIRNGRFGHRIPGQEQRVYQLFAQALIPDIDVMLHVLYDLLEAVWELYYNGKRFQIDQFGAGAKYVEERTRTNATVRRILSRLAGRCDRREDEEDVPLPEKGQQ
jgi:antirestriction protein ArdC